MKNHLEASKVNEILTNKVIALRPSFTPFDAVHIFNKYRISSAPVVNDNNEIIGYLSESDCMKCISNALFFDDKKYSSIDLVMTKEVAVAEGKWDVFELENFFTSNHLRSAPVVDSENHLIGVVTRRDVLMALEKVMHSLEEYKKEISDPVELNMQEKIKMLLNRRE